MTSKANIHPVDRYVGDRLRSERKTRYITQAGLGFLLPQVLTFRQIHKYEKAKKRISASRLYEFAELFNIPVSNFFPAQKFATVDLNEHERKLVECFRRLSPARQFALLTLIGK